MAPITAVNKKIERHTDSKLNGEARLKLFMAFIKRGFQIEKDHPLKVNLNFFHNFPIKLYMSHYHIQDVN